MMSGNDGLAGKFHNRGHLRTFQDILGGSRSWKGLGDPGWSELIVPGGLFSHQSSCCLSGLIGFVHVQWDVEQDK